MTHLNKKDTMTEKLRRFTHFRLLFILRTHWNKKIRHFYIKMMGQTCSLGTVKAERNEAFMKMFGRNCEKLCKNNGKTSMMPPVGLFFLLIGKELKCFQTYNSYNTVITYYNNYKYTPKFRFVTLPFN